MNAPWSPGPPPTPKTSRLAIGALLLSIATFFGVPLMLFVVPNFVTASGAWEALVVAVVVSGVLVVSTFVLAIVALARLQPNDNAGKLWAILALVAAILAPALGAVAGFFGFILAAGGGPHGRPLRRRGAPVLPPVSPENSPRSWSSDDGLTAGIVVEALGRDVRDELARRWLEDARTEHASVATFAKLTLDLLAAGAPPLLVARASESAADEVHHARIAYAIASRYAGRDLEPLPFVDAALPSALEAAPERLERLARESLIEGVVGEGACVVALSRAADTALDPVLAAHLRRLAVDEARHAELAADVVRFAAARLPAATTSRLAESLNDRLPLVVAEVDLAAHGRYTSSDFHAAIVESRAIARALVESLVVEPASTHAA